jgi:hypothetical protein
VKAKLKSLEIFHKSEFLRVVRKTVTNQKENCKNLKDNFLSLLCMFVSLILFYGFGPLKKLKLKIVRNKVWV